MILFSFAGESSLAKEGEIKLAIRVFYSLVFLGIYPRKPRPVCHAANMGLWAVAQQV